LADIRMAAVDEISAFPGKYDDVAKSVKAFLD
jgi:hypothetical protein